MKNLLLILALFVGNIFSDIPEEFDLLGEMTFNCVVKDQVILKIEDGMPKRFSGYEDGLEIGDKHTVSIKWYDANDFMKLENNKLGLSVFLKEIFSKEDIVPFNDITNYTSDTFTNSEYDFFKKMNKISVRGIREDMDLHLYHEKYDWDLYVSDSIIAFEGFFSLKRYYKNDWDFLHSTDTYILASNCLNAKANVSQFIKDSISLFEN